MQHSLNKKQLANRLDHTLLKADASYADIVRLCQEARMLATASVCINPCYVALASQQLQGSAVKVCTVIGFPLGAHRTASKVFETAQAINDGADEIDMVIALGALKSGDDALVESDIRAVVKAAQGRTVKVIIETCYLSDAEKQKACQLARAAGAHFVKTSTGFGTAGATEHDVALMKSVVGTALSVKASGGIRSYADALKMLAAGADRLGVSGSIQIIAEAAP